MKPLKCISKLALSPWSGGQCISSVIGRSAVWIPPGQWIFLNSFKSCKLEFFAITEDHRGLFLISFCFQLILSIISITSHGAEYRSRKLWTLKSNWGLTWNVGLRTLKRTWIYWTRNKKDSKIWRRTSWGT